MINKRTIGYLMVFIMVQASLQLEANTTKSLLITITAFAINIIFMKYLMPEIIHNQRFYKVKKIFFNRFLYFILFADFISIYNFYFSGQRNIAYSFIRLQLLIIILNNMSYFREEQ